MTRTIQRLQIDGEKLIKTLNVTCNIITKNAEQMMANQQKMIYALNIIVNKVK